MKVSLVNARNSDSLVTPYGLLSIAAVLEKGGHETQIFDPFFGNLSFIKNILEFNPDIIGISALTASYARAKDIINEIRRSMPQVKICMGGIHATALPEQTLRDNSIDFVVLGEGELVLLDICNHPDGINNLSQLEGVAFLENGHFVGRPKQPPIENLDNLPFPLWQKLPIEKYFVSPGYIRSYFLKRTLVVYSGRGCPYQCIFCASHQIFGHKLRRHSVRYFLEHLTFVIKKYRLDGIYIMDDTFILDDNWLKSFCEEKKIRNIDILWGCQGRVDAVNKEKLLMLKEVGCIQIDFGVESGSQKILDTIKKGISVQEIEEAFKLCHKVGIRPYASIMVGNPEEEEKDVILTAQLLKRIKPAYVSIGFSQPIPGSELYGLAKGKGWFDDRDCLYGPHWDVRVSQEPIMSIKLNKKKLKKLRAKLQNVNFINNYISFISFKTLFFIFSLIGIIIVNPRGFLKAIKKSFRTSKIDDIIDFVLTYYRLQNMKQRVRTLAEL